MGILLPARVITFSPGVIFPFRMSRATFPARELADPPQHLLDGKVARVLEFQLALPGRKSTSGFALESSIDLGKPTHIHDSPGFGE
jgi:hypothetical protein